MRRDQQLAQVAGGVLGRVHQHADERGGHQRPAHAAHFGQAGCVGVFQLLQGRLYLVAEFLQQLFDAVRGNGQRRHFGVQGCKLRLREGLLAGVGQQAVEHAGQVLEMESHRGHAAGPRIEQDRRKVVQGRAQLVAGLQQGVGYGLEQGRHARHGAAQPGFERSGSRHG